jgi:hypothetical protein
MIGGGSIRPHVALRSQALAGGAVGFRSYTENDREDYAAGREVAFTAPCTFGM